MENLTKTRFIAILLLILSLSGCDLKNNETLNESQKGSNTLEEQVELTNELKKIIFYRLDSIEFNNFISEQESEGLYETDSDFGYYSYKIIELYTNSKIEIEILNNKEVKTIFPEEKIEHPYGFILISTENEKMIYEGIYTDLDIKQIVDDFKGNDE